MSIKTDIEPVQDMNRKSPVQDMNRKSPLDIEPDPDLEKQVMIHFEMRKLAGRAKDIGRLEPGLGLTVKDTRNGMILKLDHEGQQVNFIDIPRDALEKKWPGVFDYFSGLLDEESVLRQKRHTFTLENRVKKIENHYPDLEISVLNDADGMVLMIEHDGQQVDFNNMRFDVLEDNWPGLSDQLARVLDDQIVFYQNRAVFKNRSTLNHGETPNHDETPAL